MCLTEFSHATGSGHELCKTRVKLRPTCRCGEPLHGVEGEMGIQESGAEDQDFRYWWNGRRLLLGLDGPESIVYERIDMRPPVL